MKPNVEHHRKSVDRVAYVEVLDDTLSNYGWNQGDLAPLQAGASPAEGIPVWELDGELQARKVEQNAGGWLVAYTHFLSAGKICYSLDPMRAGRIRPVGWISRQ